MRGRACIGALMLLRLFAVGWRTRAFSVGFRLWHCRIFFSARFDQDSDMVWGAEASDNGKVYVREFGSG